MTYVDICVVSLLLGIVVYVVARAVFVKPVFAVIDNCEENLKGLCFYMMASGRGFYQAWYYLSCEEVKIRQSAIERIRQCEGPKIGRLLMTKREKVCYDDFIQALERSKEEEKTAERDYKRFGQTV